MKDIIQIFQQLQNTSGKKDKEKIILAHKDNEMFQMCITFLLDDNIQTGLKLKSLQKNVNSISSELPKTWQECMDYFKINNTGRDVDIVVAQQFITLQDKQDDWFYRGMLTKTLKLGCDKKTVNKCIPNLIFEWQVQLGSQQDKLKLKKNEYFFLSQKLNGIRGTFANGTFLSRQGKHIKGLEHIIKDIEMLNLDTYFIDGELIRKNTDNLDDNENFRLSASIINSDSDNKSEIEFVIFDIFPLETISKNKTVEKYDIRKQRMVDTQKMIDQNYLQNLRIVPMVYEGTDTAMIEKWLDRAVELNWEGIMLNKNVPYEFKRTTNLIKLKKFYDIALRCVAVNIAETGKYKGVLGSISCKYGNDIVDCGSGFSDDERSYYATYPSEIVDKIVSIKYKEESRNKQGGKSLQFPVYQGIVYDKTIPDDEV